MIAVENVIRKLINEYEFVILPGFGALLSHQIPASFDKKSGFFSPPAKKLAFNEYLKLDDGLLANYISRHNNLSHAEAVEHVRGYVEKLRERLEATGNAQISGIGAFDKNVEGKLVFQPDTEKHFKDEWYGFEKVRIKHFNQNVPAPAKTEIISEGEVEFIEEEKVVSRRWIGWAAAAVIAGLLCGLSVFFVNSGGELRSTLNPFADLFTSNIKEVSKTETTPVEDFVEIKAEKIAAPVVNADSVEVGSAEADTAGKLAIAEEVKPVAPKVAEPHTARFYVIVGAFKGTKKAAVLVEQLKEKGYGNASILPTDKYNRKVKVAIDGYETEAEAYRASRELKSVIGEVGWVFKNKKI